MKNQRQQKVLELIQTRVVHSQEELQALLQQTGFDVTQATVSRDIKELGLVKVPLKDRNGNGSSKYVQPGEGARYASRLHRLVAELVESVAGAENVIVLKTPPGSANMVASAIDAATWPEVLGTIAGDDTLLCICAQKAFTPKLVQRFIDMKASAEQVS